MLLLRSRITHALSVLDREACISTYTLPKEKTAAAVKLALPSVDDIRARGSDGHNWYQHRQHHAVATTPSAPHHQLSVSSVGSSPRAASLANSASTHASYDSNTSYQASPATDLSSSRQSTLRTPPPEHPSPPLCPPNFCPLKTLSPRRR